MSGKIGKRTVSIEKKYISYDDPLGPIECNFEKSAKFFFQEVKICQSGSSNFRRSNPKIFFCLCNMQFKQRSQKDFANFRKFFDQSLKKTKFSFALSSLALLKKFPWTARMQIWQPCRNVFYKSQKHFGSRSEFEKKAISFSKTCSSSKERFFGNAKCSFDTSHETLWPQTLKYGSKSKMYRKKHVFWKFFFFQNYPQGPLKAVLTNACFC